MAASSGPSAPNTARRIALRVMRIIDGNVAKGVPTGHVDSSRATSSSMICS